MKFLRPFSLLVVFFLLYGCIEDSPEKTTIASSQGVSGFVQKGPFVSGSNIIVQVLDEEFNPTGQSYTVSTIDDFGSFTLESTITGSYVEFIAQGFYFNEVAGEISNASLSLRALAKVAPDMKSNVNVLTTLSKNRIIQLVKEGQLSFDDAKAQAEEEILAIFNIEDKSLSDFNTMDIRAEGTRHAILLAISSILQGGQTVGELSELISKVILDVQDNGTLDNTSLVNVIKANANNLDLSKIKKNLIKRYQQLGIVYAIPGFEQYAKRLVPIAVVKTIPLQHQLQVRYDISTLSVYFNKALSGASVTTNNITLKIGSEIIPGEVTYIADSFKIEFRPAVALLPEQTYALSIGENVTTLDSTLFAKFDLSFSTINIDIISNLLAYFPMENNSADITGHGFNAEAVNATFVPGVSNNAIKFSGAGSYLEIPNVINQTEKVWTYSIWFQLDAFDPAVGPFLLATRLSANTWWDIPLYISPSRKSLVTYNETLLSMDNNIVMTGKWHHAALVVNNGIVKMYLDGQLRATNTNFWSRQSNSGYTDFQGDPKGSYEYYSGKYYISEKFRGESWPGYLNGSVDNVRFYGRALNDYEVKKLFDNKL